MTEKFAMNHDEKVFEHYWDKNNSNILDRNGQWWNYNKNTGKYNTKENVEIREQSQEAIEAKILSLIAEGNEASYHTDAIVKYDNAIFLISKLSNNSWTKTQKVAAFVGKAIRQNQAQQYDQAITSANSALAIDPDHQGANAQKVAAYKRKAAEDAKKAKEADRRNEQKKEKINNIKKEFKQNIVNKNFDEAEENVNELLKIAPQNEVFENYKKDLAQFKKEFDEFKELIGLAEELYHEG